MGKTKGDLIIVTTGTFINDISETTFNASCNILLQHGSLLNDRTYAKNTELVNKIKDAIKAGADVMIIADCYEHLDKRIRKGASMVMGKVDTNRLD